MLVTLFSIHTPAVLFVDTIKGAIMDDSFGDGTEWFSSIGHDLFGSSTSARGESPKDGVAVVPDYFDLGDPRDLYFGAGSIGDFNIPEPDNALSGAGGGDPTQRRRRKKQAGNIRASYFPLVHYLVARFALQRRLFESSLRELDPETRLLVTRQLQKRIQGVINACAVPVMTHISVDKGLEPFADPLSRMASWSTLPDTETNVEWTMRKRYVFCPGQLYIPGHVKANEGIIIEVCVILARLANPRMIFVSLSGDSILHKIQSRLIEIENNSYPGEVATSASVHVSADAIISDILYTRHDPVLSLRVCVSLLMPAPCCCVG